MDKGGNQTVPREWKGIFKQYLDNIKPLYFQWFFEVIIDGKSVWKTINSKPTHYENVKVWAAQGQFYPVSNARIKNLVYEHEQRSKYLKQYSIM